MKLFKICEHRHREFRYEMKCGCIPVYCKVCNEKKDVDFNYRKTKFDWD